MPAANRSSILRVLVLALGAAGTVVYYQHVFRSAFTAFVGGRGDPRAFTYTLEHWYQSLSGRETLLSPRIYYPFEGTLGYSETLTGYALPYSVLRALGLEMFSAVVAVVIVFSFLSFLACFVLLHRVLGLHLFASTAAALFFAFSSPKFVQHGHLQLQFTLLLPLLFALAILFARAALDGRQRRAFGLLALFVATLHLQLLTAFGYAWFFIFWSLLFVAASLLLASTRRYLLDLFRSSRLAIAGAAALAIVGSVPFVAIYGPAIRDTPAYSYENALSMVPAARNFLDLGRTNLLWGWLSEALQPNLPNPYRHELQVGIGFVPTLAWIGTTLLAIGAAAGGFRARAGLPARNAQRSAKAKPMAQSARGVPAMQNAQRFAKAKPMAQRARGVPMFLAAMVLASWVFIALGMKYGDAVSPWRLVHAWVPGAGAVRAVARYVILLTLPMAIGFAWLMDKALGWAAARRRPIVARGTYTVLFVLASFGLCEQVGLTAGFSKAVERAYLEALAADLPADCEVFYLAAPRPETRDYEHQFDAMMVSILTGVPTINGLTSQVPRGWNLLVTDPSVYEANVRDWIARQHITDKVCRLEVGTPLEIVELDLTMAAWKVEPRDFVQRHYLDLLRREPTPEELARWVNQIEGCPRADSSCGWLHVSETIFRSVEFLGRGDYLFRLYLAGLERFPSFEEFHADMTRLDQLAATTKREEECRLAFARELVERIEKLRLPSAALAERAEADVPQATQARILATLYRFGYLQRDPRASLEPWVEWLEAGKDSRVLTVYLLTRPAYRARLGQ